MIVVIGLLGFIVSKRRIRGRLLLFGTLALSTAIVNAQSFNIDLNTNNAPPELGGGVPSDAFGAAANQPGRWNDVNYGASAPPPLIALDGAQTSARLTVESSTMSFSGTAYRFPGNTGDFALLLNDATQVASVVQGGSMTWTFSGLATGTYDVYTYAVRPAGEPINVPVYIPEAESMQTQIVTGPMPGNAFSYHVTHSIHRLMLTGNGAFHVIVDQPANMPHAFFVNGFQIVAVPETDPMMIVVIGLLGFIVSKRKSFRASSKHYKTSA